MTCNLKYTSLLLSLLAAFAACSDEWWDTKDPDAGKSPIELSVGGVDMPSSQTRAVITDGTNKTLNAFGKGTSLYMVMKSNDLTSTDSLYTSTIGFALKQDDPLLNKKSEVSFTASNEGNAFKRYWEDSYSRNSALSIYAVCTPGFAPTAAGGTNDAKNWTIGNSGSYQTVSWTTSKDEDYAKIVWPIGNTNQYINYKLKNDQSILFNNVDFIQNQDLCFSNNISKYKKNSTDTDARLKFNSTGDRKFDTGNMIFYHALSKLTFQIKKGEGYTDAEFVFTDVPVPTGTPAGESKNIQLQGFNNYGTFDMVHGEFIESTVDNTTAILQIYQHPTLTSEETTAGYNKILDALVIPGTDMSKTSVAVDFAIHGNEYKLTRKQLYDAIIANKSNWPTGKTDADYFDSNGTANTKLKAGIHYVFTFTVGKTKIEKITAQLVPWEVVDAIEVSPDNAHIKLELLVKDDNELKNGVDFYRGLNLYPGSDFNHEWQHFDWQNIYYEKANATYVPATHTDPGYWTTDWYWDSNRHFYHFRSVIPKEHPLSGNPIDASADPLTYNPTFQLESKRVLPAVGETPDQKYTDVQWGAPFKNTTQKLTYSTTSGFDGKGADAATKTHQIYWAIGPTKDEIKLISFHMMSEVKINFSTSEDGSAIDFGNGNVGNTTIVELRDCASTATVNMGDGCVVPNYPDAPIPVQTLADDISSSNKTLTWGIVPQTLEGKELRIVTPDGNEYLVDLGNIEVTKEEANPSNYNLANPYEVVNGKCKINYWYPNYKYTYNFKLVKMGIADLKATVVDWETVTADEETVQIQ